MFQLIKLRIYLNGENEKIGDNQRNQKIKTTKT